MFTGCSGSKGEVRHMEYILLVVENTGDQEKLCKKQAMRAYYECQTGMVRLQYNSDRLEQCKH
jgi:hypothetical protein